MTNLIDTDFAWLGEVADGELIALADAVLEEMAARGMDRDSRSEILKFDGSPVITKDGEAIIAEVAVTPSILGEAMNIVTGARRHAYGHPENNFGRIANLWNAYLAGKPVCAMPITPQDVALLMVLMKVARLLETPTHRDSAVDICGYAATLEMLWDGQ